MEAIKLQPKNHYQPWSETDLKRIGLLAKALETPQAMRALSVEIAESFERSEASVCKKIEELNGWHWTVEK